MLPFLLSTVFGALLFTPQDFNDFPVEATPSFTGQLSTNFRHADINNDGFIDLLGPHGILLQSKQGYDTKNIYTYPELPVPIVVDIWRNNCYFIDGENTLSIGRMEDGVWQWQSQSDLPDFNMPVQSQDGVTVSRFLFDEDDDDIPEIVRISEKGLTIYHHNSGKYTPSDIMAILPSPSSTSNNIPQFLPDTARKISYPAQQMNCLVAIEEDTVRVYTRTSPTSETTVHNITTYTEDQTETWHSPPVPNHLRPCRLNDSETISFAGQRWLSTARFQPPAGILQSWVSLDEGKSFEIKSTTALRDFRTQCFLVDFDGDNDMELITEESDLLIGGPREMAARFLTTRHIEYTLRIYKQAQGNFSKSPECENIFTLDLDGPPVEHGPMYTLLTQGRILNITGDFNGDGYKDVLIRQSLEKAVVYLASGYSFPKEANATIDTPEEANIEIADVNGDGKDDIILRWIQHTRTSTSFDPHTSTDEALCRVYFSGESAP